MPLTISAILVCSLALFSDGTPSAHNGWIREAHFPGATGQPDASDKIVLTYNPDGSVRTRTDARGVVLTHVYDERGRRMETTIDDTALYTEPVVVAPVLDCGVSSSDVWHNVNHAEVRIGERAGNRLLLKFLIPAQPGPFVSAKLRFQKFKAYRDHTMPAVADKLCVCPLISTHPVTESGATAARTNGTYDWDVAVIETGGENGFDPGMTSADEPRIEFPWPATVGATQNDVEFDVTDLIDNYPGPNPQHWGFMLWSRDEQGSASWVSATQKEMDGGYCVQLVLEPPPDPANRPAGTVSRLVYSYTDDDLPLTVTAYDESGAVISGNEYAYDARRNVTREYQSHGALVDENASPYVEYDWTFSSATAAPTNPPTARNYDRLTGITYPDLLGGGGGGSGPRALTYDYGSGLNDNLSRVMAIHDSREQEVVAAYSYAGMMRRIGVQLGNGVSQSYLNSGGTALTGLDRFGRAADVHLKTSGGATLHRYQYKYDAMGNRVSVRVDQEDVGPDTHDNDRSWLYCHSSLKTSQ